MRLQISFCAIHIIVTVFFFLAFFCLASCSSQKINRRPISKQVGMYPYRCKRVMGYDIFDAQGKLKRKVIIKRDKFGNMIEKTTYDGFNKLKAEYIYEMNKRVLLHRKIKLGSDGKIQCYFQYYYNEEWLLKEQKKYTAKDILIKSNRFYFNNLGERIRKETFDAAGRLTKIILYIFDSKNRRIRDYTLSEDGEIIKSTQYVYGAGNNIECIKYMNGLDSKQGTAKIIYGNDGDRIEKKRFDEKGALKSITKYYYLKTVY